MSTPARIELMPADALLRELQEEGAAPVPTGVRGQQVSEGYARMKEGVVAEAEGGGKARQTLGRVRYSHADCADRILMTPGIKQTDLAMIYGVTDAWMSIVINSDAFKAHLASRKEELIDPVLAATLNEKYGALASRSVEVLLEKMNQPIEKISDKLALEAAALGAKATGMGEAKKEGGGGNAVDHLAALAHRLVELNRPVPAAIDVPSRVIGE